MIIIFHPNSLVHIYSYVLIKKLNLSKGPSSYTKSDIMLELGNIEYMFSPWRLEWAQIFMKKHEFLRSDLYVVQ